MSMWNITLYEYIYIQTYLRKFTCLETYCLISSSLILEPFDFTTNATGTSPAASSFMLKQIKRVIIYIIKRVIKSEKKYLLINFKTLFLKYNHKHTLNVRKTYGTTAASAMLGWAINMASSSAGATWKPLYLISSFNRSTMKSSSYSSMYPISPVYNHPSLSMVLSVASGSFR